MTVAYQMPVRTELASKVGPQLWRKTILKSGHISKGGVELDVNRAYLENLVANFTAGAKDQVQFVLGHDENPELFRGELRGLEISDNDELVGLFETTAAGSKLIEDNPRLGASVAVLDRFERADGRKYGPTLLHVAATLDPEVSGMGDWARAELSASKTEVIDLSAPLAPTSDSEPDPAVPGEEPQKGAPVASLTDEQLSKLLKLIEGDGDSPVAEKEEIVEEVTKAELDAITVSAELPTAEVSDEPELVAAGHDNTEALELANARIDAQAVQLAAMTRERDEERFKAEAKALGDNFIPADVIQLAKPLLFGTGHHLELSAGQKVDAGQVMRTVLNTLGARFKALGLSHEYGTADADDDQARRAKENEAFFANVDKQFGRKGI